MTGRLFRLPLRFPLCAVCYDRPGGCEFCPKVREPEPVDELELVRARRQEFVDRLSPTEPAA